MSVILPDTSGLAQGITQAGSSFAQALQQGLAQRNQQATQKKYGTILQGVFSELGEDASPRDYQSALSSAIQQGVPIKSALEFGNLYATLKKAEPKTFLQGKTTDEIAGIFEKFGMDKDAAQRNAELYGSLTTGGQTEFGKMIIDQIQRGNFTGAKGAIGLKKKEPQKEQISTQDKAEGLEPESPDANVESGEVEWEWPDVNPFEGMTPKEAIKFKGELYKENNAEYKDLIDKTRAKKVEYRDLKQLERLNNSGKLPKGLTKLINVDLKEGKLRFPSGANAATQLFVKTVNGFIRNAKDNFGARVTNFDLQTFLQTLPTLANTEEGRRLILDQMKTASELLQLDYDSTKEVMEHYGLGNIDRVSVETLARDLKKDKEAQLEEKFAKAIDANIDYRFKNLTPEGRVPMMSPDGERVYILKEQVEEAKNQKFKKL